MKNKYAYNSIKLNKFRRTNKIYNEPKTKDLLIFYYQQRQYNCIKIGKIMGIHPSSIRKRLRSYGIKIRRCHLSARNKYILKRGTQLALKHGFNKFTHLYKNLHQKCEICGWNYGVDLHHIISLTKGGLHQENNVICLCPNHHRLADRGLLKISKENNQLIVIDLTIVKTENGGG